jgi:hypothetical protein
MISHSIAPQRGEVGAGAMSCLLRCSIAAIKVRQPLQKKAQGRHSASPHDFHAET